MNSVIGETALQELKKVESFKDAVIAGGYVRDSILGGIFKDIDIFIPARNSHEFIDIVNRAFTTKPKPVEFRINNTTGKYDAFPALKGAIGNFTEFSDYDDNEYMTYNNNYIGKFDCKYMGSIPAQIMGHKFDSKKMSNFGDHVVNDFSYWIDQAYFDGSQVVESENFKKDRDNGTATLCRLEMIEHLPHALKKFERLKEKYPLFEFRSNILKIEQPAEKKRLDTTGLYKDIMPVREEGWVQVEEEVLINNPNIAWNRFFENGR